LRKILIIIRREYIQGVRGKAFILSTVLAPVFMVGIFVVPGLLIGLKTGEATRVAVVDQTGRLYAPLREAVTRRGGGGGGAAEAPKGGRPEGNMETRFVLEEAAPGPRPLEEVKGELKRRVLEGGLDGYLILPADILQKGEAELYARNTGDVISRAVLDNRLSRAVIEQRMREERIDEGRVRALSQGVKMTTTQVTRDSERKDEGGSGFFFAIGVGTFIVFALMMYGQAILSAVVEEKTTRIVEVLFSSVDAFTLMTGKLVGVSLVALTQFAVWLLMSGVEMTLPSIPPAAYLYTLLFFALGFFVYATIYAVIGAIVTTEKEAQQIVVPLSFLPVIAISLAFPVVRSPGSAFSFWVSLIPFFSPVTMLVRVVTETPPFWQIALSLLLGVAVVFAMIWVAARIYRIGMLMYGKRATVPEILRWIRQA
jgi:ABC-2 type transport system permease protein